MNKIINVSMPSRADDSFLLEELLEYVAGTLSVSMPSRADDSFLQEINESWYVICCCVNALSG